MRLSALLGMAVLLLAAAPAIAQSERIAFDGDRGGDSEIYTIAPDGSQLLELTDNDAEDWNPAWSPSGRRIAYVREAEVWLMRADGSRQRAVTRKMADVRDVDWSPDGRRLVFASDHGHAGQED